MSFVTAATAIVNPGLVFRAKNLPGEADCGDVSLLGNYIVIKTDSNLFKNNVLNTIFTAGQQRCISDYIVISDSIVLVCEMKSNNRGNMRVQLRNSGEFAKYLLSMIKIHGNVRIATPPTKFVCFARLFSGKQKTKSTRLNSIAWDNDKELFELPCRSVYHLNQFL